MYSILDGCSLAIVHWEIREKMQEVDIETIVKRGLEKYPNSRPRVITDNGPQFISRDFKGFIRIAGMTHVKTWSYHPQSNGKIERYHRTIKGDCIRAKSMTSVDDVRQAVTQYVHHYNTIRLHSAIGYVTPHTKLAGKEKELFAQRDEKLEAARERRRLRRTEAIQNVA
jgi:transposase InsO family protein